MLSAPSATPGWVNKPLPNRPHHHDTDGIRGRLPVRQLVHHQLGSDHPAVLAMIGQIRQVGALSVAGAVAAIPTLATTEDPQVLFTGSEIDSAAVAEAVAAVVAMTMAATMAPVGDDRRTGFPVRPETRSGHTQATIILLSCCPRLRNWLSQDQSLRG